MPNSAERVRAHRQRLRAQGLRPVQFWLPDVSHPNFKSEARRQALLIARSPMEPDDQAFMESLAEPWPDA